MHLSNVLSKLVFLSCLLAAALPADPVAVRYQEGSVHGFLSLYSMNGRLLASGDLIQVASGDRITLHRVFNFKDGSVDDETTIFTDRGVFRLISDRHIQKGPAFPQPADIVIETESNNVTVHYRDRGQERVDSQHMALPNDLANGVIFDMLKNIPTYVSQTKLSLIAATPKPRLVKLSISGSGPHSFSIAGNDHRSTRSAIKIELGGLTGLIAPLMGKQCADFNVWISDGFVPAFVKAEGQLYPLGPLWRIALSSPVWPNP